jgi:hypothetical protein
LAWTASTGTTDPEGIYQHQLYLNQKLVYEPSLDYFNDRKLKREFLEYLTEKKLEDINEKDIHKIARYEDFGESFKDKEKMKKIFNENVIPDYFAERVYEASGERERDYDAYNYVNKVTKIF